MSSSFRSAALALAALLAAAPVFAQSAAEGTQKLEGQGGGFSLSPYIGVVLPTADLLTLSKGTGSTTGTQDFKMSSAITLGGRLGVMFTSRVGLMADVGYSPGSVNLDSTGVTANTDVTTLSGVGKLVLYLIPSSSPVWLSISGGGGAIRHSFKSDAGTLSGLKDGTNIGGVIGAGAGIRLGQLIALTGSVEDYLYDASFDNGGTKTSEKKQHDVRITGGIRIPILGM
ncbi:MAG: outer membrane beta-barrel protein [bacterium]